jgi:hypothetical protein
MTTSGHTAQTSLHASLLAYRLTLASWQRTHDIPPHLNPDPLTGQWDIDDAGLLILNNGQFTWYRTTGSEEDSYSGTYTATPGGRTGKGFIQNRGKPHTDIYSLFFHHTHQTLDGITITIDRPGIFTCEFLGDQHHLAIYNHLTTNHLKATRIA